jgi:hypothetical protein
MYRTPLGPLAHSPWFLQLQGGIPAPVDVGRCANSRSSWFSSANHWSASSAKSALQLIEPWKKWPESGLWMQPGPRFFRASGKPIWAFVAGPSTNILNGRRNMILFKNGPPGSRGHRGHPLVKNLQVPQSRHRPMAGQLRNSCQVVLLHWGSSMWINDIDTR